MCRNLQKTDTIAALEWCTHLECPLCTMHVLHFTLFSKKNPSLSQCRLQQLCRFLVLVKTTVHQAVLPRTSLHSQTPHWKNEHCARPQQEQSPNVLAQLQSFTQHALRASLIRYANPQPRVHLFCDLHEKILSRIHGIKWSTSDNFHTSFSGLLAVDWPGAQS